MKNPFSEVKFSQWRSGCSCNICGFYSHTERLEECPECLKIKDMVALENDEFDLLIKWIDKLILKRTEETINSHNEWKHKK